MSAECPHRCPNVRFRSNVRQKRQFVTKMSEKKSECPHVRMPAISIPLNVYKGIATNVREMSASQNVREMSAKCPHVRNQCPAIGRQFTTRPILSHAG